MKRALDILLGLLLWLNSFTFLLAVFAGLSFDEWIILDLLTVIICGVIGIIKKVPILQVMASIIVVAFLLRFTRPLWLLIDLLVVAGCFYVGYFFLKGKINRVQYQMGSSTHI